MQMQMMYSMGPVGLYQFENQLKEQARAKELHGTLLKIQARARGGAVRSARAGN